jgi:hypothetical protein
VQEPRTRRPTSPRRGFTKVTNSVVKVAVPAGLFGAQGGKAKELYDALWQMTRGAVVPRRKVRIPKDQLMKAAGIGSEITLKKNLRLLRTNGLVAETLFPGTHGGNEYEVFEPEEIGPSTGATPSSPSTGPSSRQNVEGVEGVDATASSPSLNSSVNETSMSGQTSLLRPFSGTDDDEAFAGFVETIRRAALDVTGREPTAEEASRWSELAELLATELKIAAGRTTVSSVPAFLTEHLRRRLWKKEKRQVEAEAGVRSEGRTPKVDASQCPDCFGTGMYYPEGFEKGVARCDHKKLIAGETPHDS